MSTDSAINHIVILGAGQSAASAAKTLRNGGYTGDLTLIGEENHLPYERPPLSKALLTGTATEESVCLLTQSFVEQHDIDFRRNVSARSIDREAQHVILSDGAQVPYDRLLIATGSHPRHLGNDLDSKSNVFYLRTIEDARAIRSALVPGGTLLALGAGWIGLEVAATARRLGMDVVVVEMADRACGRSLPNEVGEALIKLHEGHGTRVLLATQVSTIEGTDKVERVTLNNGEVLDISAVIVGIGAVANDDLARAAELEVVDTGGIVVDRFTRTSDPHIYASGDVAVVKVGANLVRFESWANAQDQGVAAAKNMLGQDISYEPNTWFWSDQYDINIQMIGRITDPGATVHTRPGENGRFTNFYVTNGRIDGVITFGQPRDMSFARKLIQKGYEVTGDELVTTENLRKLI
ncbi:pyridine nucleotide-disulfide oxidoreductase [Salipiger aestuarii]|jgi:3-phenylpropionate/trans-cinnamate dioxygenase ferredoxin reductase component|uniref:3-phenylpropionate/trans-cinnamate dioxygenase ferredoxin reductase subunit n=1 Tax=Salipiger aestuarii TaxID=568098 RepID=A0A327YBP4_9RHOB|nr:MULTISPECIES: FAD-dependent oxidoreductase [Rhodobacterales]KAA8605760.1 pyridine nucleotide-disulfide oxidoreductase [Salipiger aestuarii]KAB2539919.1 pyridine nucleotide-disulfide oxidoreductase [Salipiger aestuarii]KMK64084.1 NAD(FAD)-dependent dehydrogenase [Puniceibacterium sp. IMCC21224]RAK18500.1 3-phenylpropionate/trans-cinnamate dioxygenase ferredoxin reductase subunit [Salipiger aestuarii]